MTANGRPARRARGRLGLLPRGTRGAARCAGGVAVPAQTGQAEEVDRLVAETRPDALVVDVRMPPRQVDEGLRAARRVREEHPDVAVLVLSQYVEVVHALDELLARPARRRSGTC